MPKEGSNSAAAGRTPARDQRDAHRITVGREKRALRPPQRKTRRRKPRPAAKRESETQAPGHGTEKTLPVTAICS
jgi:hypothetical protein